MGETVEQRGRYLGVTEDARPFAKGQIGRDDDRGVLIEMEEQLPAGLSERQGAKFIENGEVFAGEIIGNPPLPPRRPGHIRRGSAACPGLACAQRLDR
jgi:hypothetical protein